MRVMDREIDANEFVVLLVVVVVCRMYSILRDNQKSFSSSSCGML